MSLRCLITSVALATFALGGCDRSAVAPTTQIATTAPATQSGAIADPASQPIAAVININGRDVLFPPARLRVEDDDGQRLEATLFSDDPPEALRSNYKGNSFYLRMQLDIADPAKLGQAQWQYQAPSSASEREDSPYGIFLIGRQTQLQPFDVRAMFRRESDRVVTVLIEGQFQIVEPSNDRGPARMLNVAAELTAQIDKTPATTQ